MVLFSLIWSAFTSLIGIVKVNQSSSNAIFMGILIIVFIFILIQMVRRKRVAIVAGLDGDQEFLANFYRDLTLSNFKLKIQNEADALRYCQLTGILPRRTDNPPFCSIHINTQCHVKTDNARKCGFRYFCPVNGCSVKLSPTMHTLFYNSHLSVSQILHIILCFIAKLSCNQTAREVHCDPEAVTDWYSFIIEVCSVIMSQPKRIGGVYVDDNGDVLADFVEVDESKISRRKYNTGRLLHNERENIWVVGGVCRRTKECFMLVVPNRTANVIDYILETRVETGTILVTDKARVYDNVPTRVGFDHYSVNHSVQFVSDVNQDIHANTIESKWGALTRTIKNYRNKAFLA